MSFELQESEWIGAARHFRDLDAVDLVSGHWRYAHASAIRADGVNSGLLGMSAAVAEDTLRRGLKAIDEESGVEWLLSQIGRTAVGLLCAPWIMDVAVTPVRRQHNTKDATQM
jgi:hypothetical protein